VGNLQEMIEEKKLHPITCLSTLDNQQKKLLLGQGVVLCSDILKVEDSLLRDIGVNKEQKKLLKEEVCEVCSLQ
jgi:hypothetical protein